MSSLSMDAPLYGKTSRGRRHDVWLIVSAALLMLTGLLSIYSIDHAQESRYLLRQGVFALLGVVVFLIFNRIKLETFQRLAVPLYAANVLMLIGVLTFLGKSRGVATRWIEIGSFQFQPSELSKILLTLTLAAYLANRQDEIKSFKTFVGAILHVVPICGLVILQPHLGATLALIVLALLGLMYAGVPAKFFPIAIGALALLGTAVWFTPRLLPDYIRERAIGAYNDRVLGQSDNKDDTYQQYQAMLAIATGGVMGSGFMQGDQKAAGTVPEQHNDFIFSVIGEEGGLVGSFLVLALFGFFFYRVWLVGFLAKTAYGRIVAGCLFGVLAFHTLVNLAMVLRIGPVVGLWLPFISYGGTALWMCMAAVGLLDQVE